MERYTDIGAKSCLRAAIALGFGVFFLGFMVYVWQIQFTQQQYCSIRMNPCVCGYTVLYVYAAMPVGLCPC